MSKYLETNRFSAESWAKTYSHHKRNGFTFNAEDIWSLHDDERENYPPHMNPYRRSMEQPNSPLDPDNITPKQFTNYLLAYMTARMELDPDYAAAVMLDLYDRAPQYLDSETIKFIEANSYINKNWKEQPWSKPEPRREFINS